MRRREQRVGNTGGSTDRGIPMSPDIFNSPAANPTESTGIGIVDLSVCLQPGDCVKNPT
jgi:hypothetical protein